MGLFLVTIKQWTLMGKWLEKYDSVHLDMRIYAHLEYEQSISFIEMKGFMLLGKALFWWFFL